MQGVLIVSSSTAVCRSLAAVLQDGRAVRACRTLSECLSLVAAERFDLIIVDDFFDDGTGEELVAKLSTLGYGFEIVPLVLTNDALHTRSFRDCGARFFLEKPFKLEDVEYLMQQVEETAELNRSALDYAQASAIDGADSSGVLAVEESSYADALDAAVDVREVSQRFRRLLARIQNRSELVRAFADSLSEQFDVDNVVVMLPAANRPVFEVAAGGIAPEMKRQLVMPLDEPLLRSLTRLGEPVWVNECERLGRENAATAIRYGERLNIQLLCPVLVRGRLRALVGLSRFHRYQNNVELISLLRLFLTFFAEALENSELYERAATAGDLYRGMLDSIPLATVAVTGDGNVAHVNPAAREIFNVQAEDVVGQPVEKIDSRLAHFIRTALETEANLDGASLRAGAGELRVRVERIIRDGKANGALALLDPMPASETRAPTDADELEQAQASQFDQELCDAMTRAVAHNFKNSFVPIQTCAELLPQRFQDEAFRDFFLQTVRENIGRINRWIDQLLNFSRLPEENDWSSIAVDELLEDALTRVMAQFPETQLECERRLQAKTDVRGCKSVLERMMFEIVRNAVEAVQDVAEPKLELHTFEEDGHLTVEVLDNGAGFDAAQVDPARPFASAKLSGNLGLGLAYAQRAATMHNAILEFNRDPQDGRTMTKVMLPLSNETNRVETQSTSSIFS